MDRPDSVRSLQLVSLGLYTQRATARSGDDDDAPLPIGWNVIAAAAALCGLMMDRHERQDEGETRADESNRYREGSSCCTCHAAADGWIGWLQAVHAHPQGYLILPL